MNRNMQPARWRAFVRRPSGRLCIHEAHFRHRGASVSLIHPSLRSAVICSARRPRSRPGNPVRLRRSGGRRRFALSTAHEPRCATLETLSTQPPLLRLRPASPTPGERRSEVPAKPPAASRCSRCSRLSLYARVLPHRLRKHSSAPNIPANTLAHPIIGHYAK